MKRPEFDKFVEEQLARIRESYEKGSALDFAEALLFCRKHEGKDFDEEKPALVVIAMPDGDHDSVLLPLREAAWDNDAFAVVVKYEAWFVELPKDADETLRSKLERAKLTRTLDKLEPPLRREKVEVHLESESFPIRIFNAEILRNGEQVRLAPWEEADIGLPRPNFKRYLPEIRDGQYALVLPIGTQNMVLLGGKPGTPRPRRGPS